MGDYRDKGHYHLILNTDNMTVEQEFEAVKRALRE